MTAGVGDQQPGGVEFGSLLTNAWRKIRGVAEHGVHGVVLVVGTCLLRPLILGALNFVTLLGGGDGVNTQVVAA